MATANHHFSSDIDGGVAAAGDQEQQSAVAVSSSPPPRRQRNGSLSPFPPLSLSLMDCGRVKDGAAEREKGERAERARAIPPSPSPLSSLSFPWSERWNEVIAVARQPLGTQERG